MKNFLFTLFITLATVANASDTPPDSFMNLEVGVLRHYGSTSGYGFTLRQYADAMKPAEGKQEWKKDTDKQWTHIITINDSGTGTKQRMALVFKEDGKYASIIRFLDNDKEVTKDYVGTAADQIMVPIAQKLGSGKKSAGGTTNQNTKASKTASKSLLNGTYGDDDFKATLEEKQGKFDLQIDGRCRDDIGQSKALSIKTERVRFQYDKEIQEHTASIESQGCKLDLAVASNNYGQLELRINESNNCCRNSMSGLLVKKK